MNKVLFIDRDGTLIDEPEDKQVDSLDKIRLLEGVIPALLQLQQAGYRLVMITNQDGLGTDAFPQADFDITHNFILSLFQSQGIVFDDILICPHTASDNCDCRKPNLGLVMPYIVERRFDPQNTYMIGDRETDLMLAGKMGIQSILVNDNMTWSKIVDMILWQPRTSSLTRKTNETTISVNLNLDKRQTATIQTPCHFLNHMISQIGKHAQVYFELNADGDIEVDDHHLVEDIAICIGQAIDQALGDRCGVSRYGFTLPMDESLASAVIDLSGRGDCFFQGSFTREKVNDLATEMVPHFFKTLAQNMKATLHIQVEGHNNHHMVEACFKAFALALKQAIRKDSSHIASTKGCL